MKKILFANGEEIEVSNVTQAGGYVNVTIHSSDIQKVLEAFCDNPAATSLMRYYAGTDLMCGYKGYTHVKEVTMEFDVVESIDYETEDATTESGFLESLTDVITIHLEKTSAVESASEQSMFAADVQSLKEDMAAINAALGGESDVD